MEEAGFFGKLPSHGDFISRRLPREFLDIWDRWLQGAIAESKAQLGDSWLDTYLTSPIWRFVLMPGVCGTSACLGLMMPSVDRVGRYFPLTIVAPLPEGVSALGSAIAATGWFDNCENLLLSVLSDNPPALEEFDNRVKELSDELAPAGRLELPTVDGAQPELRQWQLNSPPGASTGLAICSVAGGIILDQIGSISIWWAGGGDMASSRYLATRGLPNTGGFAEMLSGVEDTIPEDWQSAEEEPAQVVATPVVTPPVETAPAAAQVAAQIDEPTMLPPVSPDATGATLSLEALINSPVELAFSSAARTETGKVRMENEDAILDCQEKALWVVADGMGGHAGGRTASSAVIAAVDETDLPWDIDKRVDAVSRALQSVNRQLRSFSRHRPGCDGMGSTVAVVVAGAGMAGIVWAGDTRVYRRRGQQVDQLTVDHSEHQERIERGDISSIFGGASNVVTRAVGGEDVLQVSVAKQAIHPGDRYLICSDGVYEELSAFELAELMNEADCSAVCDAVIDAVLEGRAPDNASVVCIEAMGT